MEKIDEKGRIIYTNYINAKKEWSNYIRNIAIKEYNDRINELDKKYYKYAYFKNDTNYINKFCKSKNIDSEVKIIYKKLSLIFHPDKFNNSDILFKVINKAYTENNLDILTDINYKKEELVTYNEEQILNFIAILNGNNLSLNDCFIGSQVYEWFMNKDDCAFDSFYTSEELINHIENDYMFDNEIKYYEDLSENDDFIKKGLLKRKIRLLKEENKRLKEQIEMINKIKEETEELYKQTYEEYKKQREKKEENIN